MRKALIVATAAASFAALAAVAAPVSAADNATFTITGANTVTVTPPSGVVDLGSTKAGSLSFANRPLGTVTVSDERAKLLPEWTVTVTSTDFVLSGGDPTKAEQVVPATAIAYDPGTATPTGPGTGTYTATPAATLGAPAVVGAYVGVSGSRTVSWNPQVSFTLLANQVAGTYSGTITHSVTVVN